MNSNRLKSIVLFILGFGLFMFTRYCKFLPSIHAMILIAPIFILRFSRTLPKWKGIWLTLLGFLLSFNIALWGLFEFDNESITKYFSLVRSSMLAIVWFIPFMVDRLVYPKFKNHKLLATLTFPIVATAMLFLITYEGPFDDGSGTTNSFGYSYGSILFVQIRSLFGIWGFIFIHTWLYAIVNYFWEQKFQWTKIKKLVFIYPSILVLIFLFGYVKRNINASKDFETVKIAAIVLTPEDGKPVLMSRVFGSKETSPFNETISRIDNMVQIAGSNGAKIASFQEFAVLVNEDDEVKLRNEFKRIAKENAIYLSITYAYYANEWKGENKHLLIDPNGDIKLDYAKRYLYGMGQFGETGMFRKGEERIQYLDTPYGRIGLSICRDAGFQKFMRQAAKANVDIMLSPSYDWPKSHSAWYITTTYENGFSFVRPSYNGYSYAADYHGNVIAHMESDKTETGIMYANVPTKGIKTLYGTVGEMFGWICVILFVLLLIPHKRK